MTPKMKVTPKVARLISIVSKPITVLIVVVVIVVVFVKKIRSKILLIQK